MVASINNQPKPQQAIRNQTQSKQQQDQKDNKLKPNQVTIAQGDTLSQLAQKHQTSVEELMKLNPEIKDKNKIFAGKTLNVPEPAKDAAAAGVTSTAAAAEGNPAAAVDPVKKNDARVCAAAQDDKIAQKLNAQLDNGQGKGTSVAKQSQEANQIQDSLKNATADGGLTNAEVNQFNAMAKGNPQDIKTDFAGNLAQDYKAQGAPLNALQEQAVARAQVLDSSYTKATADGHIDRTEQTYLNSVQGQVMELDKGRNMSALDAQVNANINMAVFAPGVLAADQFFNAGYPAQDGASGPGPSSSTQAGTGDNVKNAAPQKAYNQEMSGALAQDVYDTFSDKYDSSNSRQAMLQGLKEDVKNHPESWSTIQESLKAQAGQGGSTAVHANEALEWLGKTFPQGL